jgi:hypothetical protein
MDRWPEFAAAVVARLEKGREAYGDGSFNRLPGELLGEIKEELADVCGWSFVLWCRLHDLEARLADRIAAAYLLPDQQQDRDQRGRAAVQDDLADDSSPRMVRPEQAVDGAERENREDEHDAHGQQAEAEAAHVRSRVRHAEPVSPNRIQGAR